MNPFGLYSILLIRTGTALIARSTEEGCEIVRHARAEIQEADWDCSTSAANDFWTKTYKELFNKKEANQSIAILTGCSAGATESVVVRNLSRFITSFDKQDNDGFLSRWSLLNWSRLSKYACPRRGCITDST
jgi:hypothetical protein